MARTSKRSNGALPPEPPADEPGQSGRTPRRPRCANHEGTVYWDATKRRYVGEVVFEGERRRVSDKDEDRVRSKLAQLRVDFERHRLAAKDAGRITVAQWLETWLEGKLNVRAGYRLRLQQDIDNVSPQ